MAFKGKEVTDEKRSFLTFRGQGIIISKTRGKPPHPHWKKGYYDDTKRIEVATLYAATGSVARVSDLTGVPTGEVRRWLGQEWFKLILEEIRAENDGRVDAKFNEIIDKSLEQLNDRVENGDFVLTKDGDLKRKPVTARDLSLVAAINIDKRQLLRGKPTSRTEQTASVSVEQRLSNLASQFKQLANRVPGKAPEVVDAEVIEQTS